MSARKLGHVDSRKAEDSINKTKNIDKAEEIESGKPKRSDMGASASAVSGAASAQSALGPQSARSVQSLKSAKDDQETRGPQPHLSTTIFDRLGERPELRNEERVNLFRKVQSGDATVEQLMLTSNFNANQPGPYNRRLLHLASESDNPRLVDHLITQCGANMDAEDADGWFPEHFAASADAVNALDVLLKKRKKKRMEAIRNHQDQTPLMTAAIFGSAKAAELLLKCHSVSVNAVDLDGDTAAILAARCGHANVLKVLMRASGIKLNCKNKEGKTALHFAKERTDAEMIRIIQDA